MFEKITKGNCSVSKSNPTPNQHGVFGLDLDVSGKEDFFTLWLDSKYPTTEEYETAKFFAYCLNLQQRFDIGLLEECVMFIEKIRGSNDVDSAYVDESSELLTKVKK